MRRREYISQKIDSFKEFITNNCIVGNIIFIIGISLFLINSQITLILFTFFISAIPIIVCIMSVQPNRLGAAIMSFSIFTSIVAYELLISYLNINSNLQDTILYFYSSLLGGFISYMLTTSNKQSKSIKNK